MTDAIQYPPFKTVYVFKQDGEFDHEYQAQLDPMGKDGSGPDGTYIEPVNCTDIAPGTNADNEVQIFAAGKWSTMPDYRGQTIYNQADGTAQGITQIGPIPTGFALTAPPPTMAQQIATLEADVDAYVYQIAQKKGYTPDSIAKYMNITDAQIATLATAQQATVTRFRTECQALSLWIASVWAFCYDSENAVSIGTLPVPTKDQLLAAIPAAPW